MAIDFPNSPTMGQQFAAGMSTWQWDGVTWSIIPQMVPAVMSDNPPTNPAVGQFWWRSTNGQLYLWFDDGTSKQWVQASGAPMLPIDPYPFNAADMQWRSASAGKIAVNSKKDGSGTDVAALDNIGSFTVSGNVSSAFAFISNVASCVLATAGPGVVYMRPNGPSSSVGQVYVDNNGVMSADPSVGSVRAGKGLVGRQGATGGYTTNVHNLAYAGGPVQLWVDVSNMGNITVSCDYRIKRNVADLPSMWDKVKALRPITYNYADYQGFWVGDTIEHWGFIAHELQGTLTKDAATGKKDEKDLIQGLNLAVVIAALTKALQEAMARIEVLEARP